MFLQFIVLKVSLVLFRGNYWINWVNCPLKTYDLPSLLRCGPPPLYHPLIYFPQISIHVPSLQKIFADQCLITLHSLFSNPLQSSYCYLTHLLLIGWHSVSSHWTVSSLRDTYILFTVVSPRPKMGLLCIYSDVACFLFWPHFEMTYEWNYKLLLNSEK